MQKQTPGLKGSLLFVKVFANHIITQVLQLVITDFREMYLIRLA